MKRLRWIDSHEVKYSQENVSRVSKRARRILDLLNGNLVGIVDNVQYQRIARGIKNLISDKVAAQVICGELQAIIGCNLNPAERVRLACSVSGAVARAMQENEVGILANDIPETTVWAVIRENEQIRDVTDEVYLHWRLLICNSVFAGTELFADVMLHSSRRWARQMGLTGQRFKPLKWYGSGQFIDAVLLLTVEKKLGQMEIIGATVNSAVLSHNRKLAYGRSRQHTACPYGARYDCGQCGVGRNQCERSTVLQDTFHDLS